MRKFVRTFSIGLIFLSLVVLGGCKKMESAKDSGGTSNSAVMEEPKAAGAPSYETTEGTALESKAEYSDTAQSQTTEKATDSRKVIKRARLEMETKKFDAAVDFVIQRTDKEKGYIESSNIYGGKSSDGNYVSNRSASFVVRIPKDKMNSFLKDTEALGVIVNRSDNDEDVTSQYFDTEARVKTLKIQEERLLAILQKTEKLTDVIELEKRLSDIRTEIEGLTGTLKRYDNLVALATVEINIREVQEEKPLQPKPDTFADKIVDSFNKSVGALYDMLKGIVIIVVTLVPFLLLAAVIFVPVGFIMKKVRKNKKEIHAKDDSNNGNE